MACFNGRYGALALGATEAEAVNVALLTSWTVSESVDTLECSYMGAAAKEFHAGLKSWEGSAEALFTDDSANIAASEINVGSTLYFIAYPSADTAIKYHGNVIVTSMEVSATMDDTVRVSLAFQGTGELQKALTATP